MRLFAPVTLGLIVCAAIFAAGADSDSPELRAAGERAKKLAMLVEAGAASRAQLAEANEAVADAEDTAVLRATMHGGDLTEEQAEEMIAAAGRRLERRQRAYDRAEKLVEQGLASQSSLAQVRDDLEFAQSQCALARERADLTTEIAAAAQAEAAGQRSLTPAPEEPSAPTERFEGDGAFSPSTLARVESAFENRFGKPLPISAMGETAVHRALGFDHRGRVDVAVNPDQPEGVWLRQYLAENHIPYFAFRRAVPGKATGAHIHVGPESTRLGPHGV